MIIETEEIKKVLCQGFYFRISSKSLHILHYNLGMKEA